MQPSPGQLKDLKPNTLGKFAFTITREGSSSDPKGKGRATEFAHLPSYGHNHRGSQEDLDSEMDWTTKAYPRMPPLVRAKSHSEDAPDDFDGFDQQQTARKRRIAHDASLARRLQEVESEIQDFTHLPQGTESQSEGAATRSSISWSLPEGEASREPAPDSDGDTYMAEGTQKGGRLFGDIPDCPPSPRPRHLKLDDDGSEDALSWIQEIELDDDFNCKAPFRKGPVCPPSPRPRDRELHPIRISDGNLDIEDAYTREVEEVEPDVEYPHVEVGVGPFLVYGFISTTLVGVQGSLALNVIENSHPHPLDALKTCFLNTHNPAVLQQLQARHSNQWLVNFDRVCYNYGQKRSCWVVAVLDPVYQASIDLRFRLLAPVFFALVPRTSYANRPPLREGGKTLLPDKISVRVLRGVRRRKRKLTNPIHSPRPANLRGGQLCSQDQCLRRITGIMADQVSGLAGGATGGVGGAGLGSITSALQSGVRNLINTGQGYLDRWFPPDKRESLKAQLTKFAMERPKLAAFILSQVALSGLPLALFLVMTITVILFSLIAGLLVGLVGALLFIVFTLGIALCFLLPTLFFTTFAAVFIFLWGLVGFYIVKWFNEKSIPGIHTGLKEGLQEKMDMQGVPLFNGEAPPPPPPSERAPTPALGTPRPQKIEKHEKMENADEEKENRPPQIHKDSSNSAKKQQSSQSKGTGTDVMNNVTSGLGGELRRKTAGTGV